MASCLSSLRPGVWMVCLWLDDFRLMFLGMQLSLVGREENFAKSCRWGASFVAPCEAVGYRQSDYESLG